MRRVILMIVSLCIALLAVGCAGAARAQIPQLRGPDSSVGAALRSLASRAGVVFVGRVTAIVPQGGVVEVSFAVEQQVLGMVGETYSLREWAGLWAAGQQRYRVGQRAMFFLHAPGVAGRGRRMEDEPSGAQAVAVAGGDASGGGAGDAGNGA